MRYEYFEYVLSNPIVKKKLRLALPKDKLVLKGDFH